MRSEARQIRVAAGQIKARLMNEASATLESIESTIVAAARQGAAFLVLPECVYPAYLLGSVRSYREGDHMSSEAFLAWLCNKAAEHRLHIASGFVEEGGEVLHNAAVLIDDEGKELGRTRKHFLWHADHDWFEPGTELRAFDTRLGRIGMTICAETRLPEGLATLVADGAELIAMPTCWINHARDPRKFVNPLAEFVVEARAREFDVPFVCADKYGLELAGTGYVGQSKIIRSDGSVAAEAPAVGETLAMGDLDLKPPSRIWISDRRRQQLLADEPPRRPEGDEPRPVTIAAVPTSVAEHRFGGQMGEALFEPMRKRGVVIAMVNMPLESTADALTTRARAFDLEVVAFPNQVDVFRVGPARVGCVAGQWVQSFAASRALALAGAEVLMYFDVPEDIPVLRTRALENHVYVVGANAAWGVIIGPDGTVLAQTSHEGEREAVATIDLSGSANKAVAPKTDIFAERRVALYRF